MRTIFLIVLMLLLAPPMAFAQRAEKKGKVYFSNIAPGELEDEFIKKFPAKIVFQSESGIPYAGVYVRIFNASGIAIFKHLCEKPWLFLKLPPGDYNVVATDRKQVERLAPFEVKKEEGKQTTVTIKWPIDVVGY